MLPPFIIEQIRKRERELRREQPQLELPTEPLKRVPAEEEQEKVERGVIIVEI